MDFSDEEIREELARLGYDNVPADKLCEFKKDLLKLIESERSKNNSLNSSFLSENKYPEETTDHNEGQESIQGDFTNHGNQWIQQQNQGQETDAEENNCNGIESEEEEIIVSKPKVPGAYSLYELPLELDKKRKNKSAKQNTSNNMDYKPLDCSSSRVVKRKTCRMMVDGARRVDESFTSDETDGMFEVYEKIKSMAMRDCECDKKKHSSGSSEEPPYRLRISKKNSFPSVIHKSVPPHDRFKKAALPFEKNRYYQQMWKAHAIPGETTYDKLCKKIHMKMMKKDEIKLDPKIYVPNNYVIPSEKNRKALRWRIRHALERFEIPEHGLYHDL